MNLSNLPGSGCSFETVNSQLFCTSGDRTVELLYVCLQDFVVAEHVGLLRSSRSEFIQELFAETDAELAEAAAIAGGKVRRGTKSAFKLNSVGAQFRKQLQVI